MGRVSRLRHTCSQDELGMDERQDFGSYLRSERELRQIPLGEMAAVTKIPVRTLERLERGDWDTLPPRIFVRGFVRSYGRHLGIEGETTSRFCDALGRIRSREDRQVERVGDAATVEGSRRRFGLALFVLILLIIVTITFSVLWGVGSHASAQAARMHAPSAPAVGLASAAPPQRSLVRFGLA